MYYLFIFLPELAIWNSSSKVYHIFLFLLMDRINCYHNHYHPIFIYFSFLFSFSQTFLNFIFNHFTQELSFIFNQKLFLIYYFGILLKYFNWTYLYYFESCHLFRKFTGHYSVFWKLCHLYALIFLRISNYHLEYIYSLFYLFKKTNVSHLNYFIMY